jgi:hypothetical protein
MMSMFNFTGPQTPANKKKIMEVTEYDEAVGHEGWRKVKKVMITTFVLYIFQLIRTLVYAFPVRKSFYPYHRRAQAPWFPKELTQVRLYAHKHIDVTRVCLVVRLTVCMESPA